MADEEVTEKDLLLRIARELKTIREQMGTVLFAIRDAESEIPEKMRRFIMYMHDVHDVMWMYHENGQQVPDYINREAERCDDRYRQLLTEMHTDGGAFEKVRREMATDPMNRWKHTREIAPPTHKKETAYATRPSNDEPSGLDQG
jgi:hypothetical protein